MSSCLAVPEKCTLQLSTPGWQAIESTPEPCRRCCISRCSMRIISFDVPYAWTSLLSALTPLHAARHPQLLSTWASQH